MIKKNEIHIIYIYTYNTIQYNTKYNNMTNSMIKEDSKTVVFKIIDVRDEDNNDGIRIIKC